MVEKKTICATKWLIGIWTILLLLFPTRATAMDLRNNPHITWSKDQKAFTTDSGDRNYTVYPKETSVVLTKKPGLRELKEGEHYYIAPFSGEMTVRKWEVRYSPGKCIHNGYGVDCNWHMLQFGKQACGKSFKCGWIATCAWCDEELPLLVYMDMETAKSIKVLPMGKDYYYLCPWCNNLEQGRSVTHSCKNISYNKYIISYNKNSRDAVGYMEDSHFMYNHATVYEGNTVVAEKRLRKNTYVNKGYCFVGWNTKADGTGQFFADEQEIQNLTSKDKEVIILYAIWEDCESILEISPGEGKYLGKSKSTFVKGKSGQIYRVKKKELTAPAGHIISFDSKGGQKVPNIRTSKKFLDWKTSVILYGDFDGETYTFGLEPGIVDSITAIYEEEAFVLPNAKKEGYILGGWYFDLACKELAGMPGERIIATRDMTLYANWVNLALQAIPNYEANSGKGAVDLRWSQKDDTAKSYLLYQRPMKGEEHNIFQKDEVVEALKEMAFTYSGKVEKWVVKESGFYELAAYGAQGENYDKYAGGKGGVVSGRIYLQRGDILTIQVGGQNGYHLGGNSKGFAKGGGATKITSQKKGLLLIAGGGGGAGPTCNGGAGGNNTGLRADGKSSGETGDSGGGGGSIGGRAGQYKIHYHDKACFREDVTSSNGFSQNQVDIKCSVSNMHSVDTIMRPLEGDFEIGGHNGGTEGEICQSKVTVSNIKVSDYDRLSFFVEMRGEGGAYPAMCQDRDSQSIMVTDQKGTILFYENRDQLEWLQSTETSAVEFSKIQADYLNAKRSVGWTMKDTPSGAIKQYVKFVVNFSIPEGVEEIKIVSSFATKNNCFHAHTQRWSELMLVGERKTKLCPYDEGEVLSAKASYGGSNESGKDIVLVKNASSVREKNGLASIKVLSIGYQEEQEAIGVAAPDLAKPNAVKKESVTAQETAKGNALISWKEPLDCGTTYFHRVESYHQMSMKKLCESNETKTQLVSGIAGFYCVVDTSAKTTVNEKNGSFQKNPRIEVKTNEEKCYLHVASVDKAGNISDTIHIPCGKKNGETLWKPMTENLQIKALDARNAGENPAENAEEDAKISETGIFRKDNTCYYVKADGLTPWEIVIRGYLNGPARKNYQIDEFGLQCTNELDADAAGYGANIPRGSVNKEIQEIAGKNIATFMTAAGPLQEVNIRSGTRSNHGTHLELRQCFVFHKQEEGKKYRLTPRAVVHYDEGQMTSDIKEDETHSIYVIGDGTPPEIQGVDLLKNLLFSEMKKKKVQVTLQAMDQLSGVKSFTAELVDEESYNTWPFAEDENHKIQMEITRDFLATYGKLKIVLRAEDMVGNESYLEYSLLDYGISASLERILEPHDPVFKTGESGKMQIEVWGYVDKIEVEFPEELVEKNPELNKVYIYEHPKERTKETLQFMVPLYTPPGTSYKVIIRGFKAGTNLNQYPKECAFVVTDSVLDEIRTRLR